MKPETTAKTPAVQPTRDRAAFRAAYKASVDQLKKIPASGTPGRAGYRNK